MSGQVKNRSRGGARVRLAGVMRIQQWTPGDDAVTRGCYDVMFAAHQVDDPVEPPPSYRGFGLYLRTGWAELPGEVWVSTSGDGTVTGFYRIGLPDLENRDKANGGPTVHPAARRHGIGRELLRHAGTRAEVHGRTLFSAQTMTGSPGDDFARAVGARLDQEEVRRIQYLAEIAPGTVAALRAEAEKAAAGLLAGVVGRPDPRGVPRADGRGVQRVQRRAARGKRGAGDLDRRPGPGPDRGRVQGRGDAQLRRGRAARQRRRDGGLHRGARRPARPRNGATSSSPRSPGRTAATGWDCWSRRRCWTSWPRPSRS